MARYLLPLAIHFVILVRMLVGQVEEPAVLALDLADLIWVRTRRQRGHPPKPYILGNDHVAAVLLAAHVELAATHM